MAILRCENCARTKHTHEYQDEKYGLYNRVMNEMNSGNFKCTVCDTKSDKSVKSIEKDK